MVGTSPLVGTYGFALKSSDFIQAPKPARLTVSAATSTRLRLFDIATPPDGLDAGSALG